jgi:predicted O-methyltransferase YrrM
MDDDSGARVSQPGGTNGPWMGSLLPSLSHGRTTRNRRRGEEEREGPLSLSTTLLKDILEHAKPLGHREDPATLNLGFGFVYYGLVRALRPRHVLVIGSGFGFSVVCLALGLKDNARGTLTFVDPSYSVFTDGPLKTVGGTAQWSDPQRVRDHFRRFGVDFVVTHHKLTSAELFADYCALGLPPIDLAFIDGSHAYADVRDDFVNVVRHAARNSYVLLHDTNIYVRELIRHAGVKRFLMQVVRYRDDFEVIDFPLASGVAIVRVLRRDGWRRLG